MPQPQATTNKQTTVFCSKLGIYDPMALLLGTATSRPSMAGLSLSSYSSNQTDSTMAAASARLASLTPSVVADKEALEKRKEAKSEEEAQKVKLSIPAPKEEASSQDFLAVLDSIGNGGTKETEEKVSEDGGNVESINEMFSGDNVGFVIDKSGAADNEEEEIKPPPVKQLKRRNASLYASNDE